MSELTWMIDATTGDLIVEGLPTEGVPALASDLLPTPHEIGCAWPIKIFRPSPATTQELAGGACVRIAGYYHNSLIEGPGRRTTVKFQGCAVQCRGCITPDSWDPSGGTLVPVDRLAEELLDPAYERDGISIVGGEPFDQADALRGLVQALRARGCRHILAYSGYTYERLQRMAKRQPAIAAILNEADVLIDGPFVQALIDGGGPWTGSGNQRVIDLTVTRRTGRIVLLSGMGARTDLR